MRPRMIIAGVMLTLAGSLAAPARAEEGYRHGRLRFVEPGVSLQRASGVGSEEADANEPFLPGDRVWTNAAGRAEFQFPDGSLVRLDLRSKLDYSGHDERDGERIVLRLWSGSLYLRVRAGDARFEIEGPAGTLHGLERSLVRVDVDAGQVRVSVYEGEAVLDGGQETVRLAAGERTYARWGDRAEEPQRFDLDEEDDFARWNADQDSQERWDGRSAQYLPDELDAYAGEFDTYGDWSYETSVGYVWVPRVEVDWHPYSHGRWCWTPYGWTWVPNERWGWAPSHYGRWGHGQRGWYWIPGRTWGPAWVSWAVGGGYVGWCPLGWRDRPVRDWDSRRHARNERGHAVPRGRLGAGQGEAWNVVRQGELGHRDLARRRVSIERVDPAALQVAVSARLRPTRDAMRLREGEMAAHAISTRPMPGDFVRELAVDNKTAIREPWFRRDGAASRGDAQLRKERYRATGGASEGAMQHGFRRAPDSSARSTPKPWSGPVAQPRAREQTPAAPSIWREPERVWGGGEERSRGDGAAVSRRPDTSGGGWSRPSGESAAERPHGDTWRPSGGEKRSSGGEKRSSGGGRSKDGASAQKRGRK